MSSLFRAFRGRPFTLLWSGQTISLLGDRIFQVALAWWVLQETGSAAAMGTVLVLSIVPMLLFLLIGGVLVDRFPRVLLMLISDIVRGVVIGMMAILSATDQLMIWHVYLFSLVSGFVEAFFRPAYRAAIPDVVPEPDLPSGNSLISLSEQMSGILGPAAGSTIVALGGTSLAFALDSLSFFASGLCLLPILKVSPRPQPTDTPRSITGDLRQGLAAVMASPWLWITIAIAGVSNIAYAGPMEVVLPFLLNERTPGDVGVLGVFYSMASSARWQRPSGSDGCESSGIVVGRSMGPGCSSASW